MASDERPRPFVLQWRSAVLNSDLSATQKLCLLVLAEWADSDGTNCRPAMETIARKASVNEKSVRRAMDAAAPLGWFGRQHRRSRKGWKQFEYTLLIPLAADSMSCRNHDAPDTESVAISASTGPSVHMHRTLCPDAPDTESNDLSITYPRPSKEQKHVQTELITANRFEEFWKVYPRREAKASAEKSWTRQGLDGVADRIVEDVTARVADAGQWTERKFTPLPATYLNGQRWEDEWKPSTPSATITALPRETNTDAINKASMDRLGIAA